MTKLKTIRPLVSELAPRIGCAPGSEAERHRYRDATQPWRAWYKTARWQKLRWSILLRDLFACQTCKRVEADTSKLVCDHVEPHRGDEQKFWSGPFQTLCKDCHDRVKQSEERRGYSVGNDVNGRPLDRRHPWNRADGAVREGVGKSLGRPAR